jgi:hypothetical protein
LQTAQGHGVAGRHIVLNVERGAAVNLYADQNRTILAHMEVPSLEMHTSSWFVLNWGLADLGPKFDPLHMHANRTRASATAAAAATQKNLQLPRLLHLVPIDFSFARERRRRVFRRLRNFVTRGLCLGSDVPDSTLRSRSTAPRIPTIKPTAQGIQLDDTAENSQLACRLSDRSEKSNELWTKTLSAAKASKALLSQKRDLSENGTPDDSDAEHGAQFKTTQSAKTLPQSHSISRVSQEDDGDETGFLSKHDSSSLTINASAQGSFHADLGATQPPSPVCSDYAIHGCENQCTSLQTIRTVFCVPCHVMFSSHVISSS